MEGPLGVMKFVEQTGRTDAHGQACFLMHFAGEVFGQALVGFGTATGRAPQIAAPFEGVNQKQAVVVHDDGTGGEADGACRGKCHGATVAMWVKSGNPDLTLGAKLFMLGS